MRRGRPERAGAGLVASLAALAVAAGACGAGEPHTVPNVTGLPLDAAEARLDARGLDHSFSGGGTFGVLVRSHWQVCEQVPSPGAMATEVALVVDRSCPRVSAVHAGVVPDVENERLDEAEEELVRAGLGFVLLPGHAVLVRSHWTVCDQDPGPGEWGHLVELTVERDCRDW